MIFWLLYVLIEAYIQAKLTKLGNRPDYIQLFIIRGIFAIIHGALLNVSYYDYSSPFLLGFQVFSFYTLFDFLLNFFRGRDWNYKGLNSGWLDKLPYPYWYSLKVVSLLLSIFFYIKGLEYYKF